VAEKGQTMTALLLAAAEHERVGWAARAGYY